MLFDLHLDNDSDVVARPKPGPEDWAGLTRAAPAQIVADMRVCCLGTLVLALSILARPAHAEGAATSAGPPSVQSAPTSNAQQPFAPPSAVACPICPAGTVCVNGGCAAAYYPQCPPGWYFDGVRSCLPVPYGAYSPAYLPVPYGAYPLGDRGEDPEEARLQASRDKRRLQSRFTLDAEGMLGLMGDANVPVITPTVAILAGFRRNFAPRFGMILRGGVLAGKATFEESNGNASNPTDSTSMLGVLGEVIPFWGPFGRFYVGPTIWLARLSFGKPELQSGSTFVWLRNDTTLGIGFHCGVLLGQEERTVLSFGARVSNLNGITLLLTAAIGFQLGGND